MGSIHRPPVSNLALALAQAGGLKLFVETGTFQGDSLRWASQHFERVWTVEINAQYQAEAQAKVGPLPNVEFVLGNSAEQLGRICTNLLGPALFWLDAHAGAGHFDDADNCPLTAELEACLVRSKTEHCILVDDARAFVAPPPPPFDYKKWPSLEDVMAVVLRRGGYHVAVISDVMAVVPIRLRDVVAQYTFQVRRPSEPGRVPSAPRCPRSGLPRTGTRAAFRPRRSTLRSGWRWRHPRGRRRCRGRRA